MRASAPRAIASRNDEGAHLAVRGQQLARAVGHALRHLQRQQEAVVLGAREADDVVLRVVGQVEGVGDEPARELHRLARENAVIEPEVDGSHVVAEDDVHAFELHVARHVELADLVQR
eukprot:3046716-Pleurochrysis_carterae.AAC.1